MPAIGTDGEDSELDELITRAQDVLMVGQRVMADLAAMINDHHSRRRHVEATAAACEQRIIDTSENVIADLERRLAAVKDEDE